MNRSWSSWISIITAALAVIAATGVVSAEDWPMYRHDIRRSGITTDALGADLSLAWTFIPVRGPEVAWPDSRKEKPRTQFDEVFQVAVSGGKVFFGSSSDNKVYALHAATGEVVWTAFTGGPIRCAPTVCEGKVYIGSDDGYAYCLDASTGAVLWRVRIAFVDRRVVGNEKMISLWPVRTGVLVDGGVAYFGAGVFPHEGTFVCAVNADTGAAIWRNDTCGEEGAHLEYGGMTPQGYALASESVLYVPSGRAMPGAFDRATGEFLYYCSPGGKIGGTWALVVGDRMVAGMEGKRAYDEKTGEQVDAEYAWFPGYQLLVTDEYSYLLDHDELRALDRSAHEFAGQWRSAVIKERDGLKRKLDVVKQALKTVAADQRVASEQRAGQLEKEIAALDQQRSEIEAAVHKWRRPLAHHEAMILAGNALVIGGQGHVVTLDAATGGDRWAAEVEGRAAGLAVADGRLFVSTDSGAIHCFAAGGGSHEIRPPVVEHPYADESQARYGQAAEAILEHSGVSRGFCLVLGSREGRLALELAKRSDLKVIGLEADETGIAKARLAVDAAGLHGRVIFEPPAPEGPGFADYFANLIVSQTAVDTGLADGDASEVFRMLKPCGGVLCLGCPESRDITGLRSWIAGIADVPEPRSIEDSGVWTVVERGPLPGAGSWTHQYADTANTACSDDTLVRAPLGVLWFGEPGPEYMVERHARPAAPVAIDGRLFVQGENRIMAYDAYNGVLLWQREMPGAIRVRVDSDMSNLVAQHDGVYVAIGDTCTRLDPATGEVIRTYTVAPGNDGSPRRWGYLACIGHTLYGTSAKPLQKDYGDFWKQYVSEDGSWQNLDTMPADYRSYAVTFEEPDERAYWLQQQNGLTWHSMNNWPAWGSVERPEGAVTTRIMASDSLFALDVETGETRWTYQGDAVAHPAIAIAEGTVFLADCGVSGDEEATAIEAKKQLLARGTWEEGGEMQYEPQHADVRRLLALDADTGEKRWERVIDLTGCGGDRLGLAYKDGVLLAFGCFSNHDRNLFREGKLSWRRITAVDGGSGADLWSKPLNYLRRPLVIGDEILIEPRACDLRTGAIKTRRHPLTGHEETWEFVRPGHCCSITSASPTMFFLRGYFLWYYDLVKDQGMLPFGGMRPGCWLNTIPANGLLLFPEASAGCGCSYPVRCSVALQPRPPEAESTWAIMIQHGAMRPVTRMAVNLGAPGDWRDDDGTLWFGYPHPRGNSFFTYDTDFVLGEKFIEGMGFRNRNLAGTEFAGLAKPWLYASAAQGLVSCALPLLDAGSDPVAYTVRLYFVDTENDAEGARVFSVKLQNEMAEANLDIVKEAGGRNKTLVREFKGIRVTEALAVELIPRTDALAPHQVPVLSGIEAIREDVALAQCR